MLWLLSLHVWRGLYSTCALELKQQQQQQQQQLVF